MPSNPERRTDVSQSLREVENVAQELSNSTGNVLNLLIQLRRELAPTESATLDLAIDLSSRSVNLTRTIRERMGRIREQASSSNEP